MVGVQIQQGELPVHLEEHLVEEGLREEDLHLIEEHVEEQVHQEVPPMEMEQLMEEVVIQPVMVEVQPNGWVLLGAAALAEVVQLYQEQSETQTAISQPQELMLWSQITKTLQQLQFQRLVKLITQTIIQQSRKKRALWLKVCWKDLRYKG